MGVVEIFLLALSSIMAAQAAAQQAQAQKDALEYNAAVAKNAEIMAGYEKQAEAERGVQEELDLRQKTRRLKGTQVAEMAAAGLDLSEGSAADILAGTDFMGEVDALRIRDDSMKRQWAIDEKAKGYAGEALFQRTAASRVNPSRAAGYSLLQSASSAYAKTYTPSGSTTSAPIDNRNTIAKF